MTSATESQYITEFKRRQIITFLSEVSQMFVTSVASQCRLYCIYNHVYLQCVDFTVIVGNCDTEQTKHRNVVSLLVEM